MTTPEQREAREAYDAAYRKRQQLIDESETLIAELEARKTAALNRNQLGSYVYLARALARAEARLERRADVEF